MSDLKQLAEQTASKLQQIGFNTAWLTSQPSPCLMPPSGMAGRERDSEHD